MPYLGHRSIPCPAHIQVAPSRSGVESRRSTEGRPGMAARYELPATLALRFPKPFEEFLDRLGLWVDFVEVLRASPWSQTGDAFISAVVKVYEEEWKQLPIPLEIW